MIPMMGLLLVLAGWLGAAILLPPPEDSLVNVLGFVAMAGGFAVLVGQFYAAVNLDSKYPALVIAGGVLCLMLSGFCLWKDQSIGLLVRLSLPVCLTAFVWYYVFSLSMFRGKQLISKLRVGERFPDFALPDSENRQVTLASLSGNGPVLMVFYKGDW